MTRDFNKPRRDASHSSFRNSSPNRNRDERPPRTRLNRETVDRAWESGAQQQHADYRPRTGGGQFRKQGQRTNNGNGNWNNPPNRQEYPSQNGRSGSRPHDRTYNRSYNDNRQDNFRDNRSNNYRDDRSRTPRSFDRSYGTNNDYRPARSSYEQERDNFGGQRFENRRNSFEGPNRRGNDNRQQGDRGNSRRNFGDNDRPHWQNRSDEQRNGTRGPERNFNRRHNDADERFKGDYEQFDESNTRSPRSVERGYEGRTFRAQRPNERQFVDRDTQYTRPSREGRFEDRDNRDTRSARSTERPFNGNRSFQDKPDRRFNEQKNEAPPEKHVTRLPDGRVVKGSRSAQRKKAQFWTDVVSDTDELVDRVQETDQHIREEAVNETPQAFDEDTVEISPATISEVSTTLSAEEPILTNEQPNEDISTDTSAEEGISETTPPKRRTRTTSAVTRTKKPRSTGPKPSQRGFKWPTQE